MFRPRIERGPSGLETYIHDNGLDVQMISMGWYKQFVWGDGMTQIRESDEYGTRRSERITVQAVEGFPNDARRRDGRNVEEIRTRQVARLITTGTHEAAAPGPHEDTEMGESGGEGDAWAEGEDDARTDVGEGDVCGDAGVRGNTHAGEGGSEALQGAWEHPGLGADGFAEYVPKCGVRNAEDAVTNAVDRAAAKDGGKEDACDATWKEDSTAGTGILPLSCAPSRRSALLGRSKRFPHVGHMYFLSSRPPPPPATSASSASSFEDPDDEYAADSEPAGLSTKVEKEYAGAERGNTSCCCAGYGLRRCTEYGCGCGGGNGLLGTVASKRGMCSGKSSLMLGSTTNSMGASKVEVGVLVRRGRVAIREREERERITEGRKAVTEASRHQADRRSAARSSKELVMFWLWPQAKKPWLFGFGTQAKAKPTIGRWPGLRFSQAKAKYCPNSPPEAMAQAKARPKPVKTSQSHGFGFGLASDFRKPKPWLSGQAKARISLVKEL
ncbi:hypothetical protein C8R44DRAFT_734778 [Mycena epipterygia]|nr:hypothetical protein C8R44DRAFT_734778 [Mycena epipterygia]